MRVWSEHGLTWRTQQLTFLALLKQDIESIFSPILITNLIIQMLCSFLFYSIIYYYRTAHSHTHIHIQTPFGCFLN